MIEVERESEIRATTVREDGGNEYTYFDAHHPFTPASERRWLALQLYAREKLQEQRRADISARIAATRNAG